MTLQILRCGSCTSPVPLGSGSVATCPHCGKDVPIPAAYVEMRDARAMDAAYRPRAEKILRSLDRPPSIVTKVLARVLDQPMFLFWLFFGVPVGLIAIIEGMSIAERIGRHYGARSEDVPYWFSVMIIFACLLVMVFVPRALGIYANRRATDRTRLLRALAAKPPEVEGGPSRCRSCGAPLDLADAIVARCVYCGCESALRIETKIAAKAAGVARELGASMEDAARTNAEQRWSTLEMMAKELARYLFHTAVFAGLFIMGSNEKTEDGTPGTLGIIGIVGSAFYLIGLFIVSLVKKATDDADDRRSGNDVPAWVGIAGPIGLWLVGCAALQIFR